MIRGSENLENFKLRAVAAAAGQTFVCVGGRSRQAEAAGVDESLIAWGWCAVDFFAHVSGFFTDDVVGCQKTGTLFSRRRRLATSAVLAAPRSRVRFADSVVRARSNFVAIFVNKDICKAT